MTEERNDVNRFGGRYLIQDQDHMSEIPQVSDKASRSVARQSEQHQTRRPDMGRGDENASPQRKRQLQTH